MTKLQGSTCTDSLATHALSIVTNRFTIKRTDYFIQNRHDAGQRRRAAVNLISDDECQLLTTSYKLHCDRHNTDRKAYAAQLATEIAVKATSHFQTACSAEQQYLSEKLSDRTQLSVNLAHDYMTRAHTSMISLVMPSLISKIKLPFIKMESDKLLKGSPTPKKRKQKLNKNSFKNSWQRQMLRA
jgi:hypothetical protein